MPYTYDDLMAIQRCDPDGGEREPTEEDYAAFARWVVATFGQDAWDRYAAGGWGRESGYHDGGVWEGEE